MPAPRVLRVVVPPTVIAAVAALVVVTGPPALSGGAPARAVLWSSRIGDGAIPGGVGLATDGPLTFTIGTIAGDGSNDILTVAADSSTGAVRWKKRYDGPAHLDDAGDVVATGPDGTTVYTAGRSYAAYGAVPDVARVVTGHAAADGQVEWRRRLQGQAEGGGTTLLPSPDGNSLFVVGTAWDINDSYTLYEVTALDASTGEVDWRISYDGPFNSGNDFTAGATLSADGDTIYVTGQLVAGGNTRAGTAAFDTADGSLRWESIYSGTGTLDYGGPIALSPDQQTLFVGGTSKTSSLTYEGVTIAYDTADGSERWHRRSSFASVDSNAGAASLAPSPDGAKVFVSFALWNGPTNDDIALVALDADDGARRWSKRFTSKDDFAIPGELAVSADSNRVYLAGQIDALFFGAGRGDLALLCYAASDGALRWVGRYDDAAHPEDGGRDLALSPSGSRAYVSGWRSGKNGAELLTVAFQT